MTGLRDHEWRLKYTPDDGDLVRGLYLPLLACAVRYDRLTGYFNASALALAARGVEGMVRNNGHMRMVVGCTLAPEGIATFTSSRPRATSHASSSRACVMAASVGTSGAAVRCASTWSRSLAPCWIAATSSASCQERPWRVA